MMSCSVIAVIRASHEGARTRTSTSVAAPAADIEVSCGWYTYNMCRRVGGLLHCTAFVLYKYYISMTCPYTITTRNLLLAAVVQTELSTAVSCIRTAVYHSTLQQQYYLLLLFFMLRKITNKTQ